MLWAAVTAVLLPVLLAVMAFNWLSPKLLDFRAKHVLITGGSAGIGLAIAKEALARGANVTLVARTKSKLEEAAKDLRRYAEQRQVTCKVVIEAADVTDAQQVKTAIEAAEDQQGPVDVLICNAGSATPGYFHEQGLDVFEQTMKLNYYGVLNSIKAVYNKMVARNSGQICLVSSILGTLGIVGYASYCPSKYAVLGLAHCLRQELLGTNVGISVAYPPDTDTPGYKQENDSKPKETQQISSEGSTLFKPDAVARLIIHGLERRLFSLPTNEVLLQLHIWVNQGLSPRTCAASLVGVLVGPLIPIFYWVYLWQVDGIAKKFAPQRFAKLWSNKQASS